VSPGRDRGDRLHPSPTDRTRWVLLLLARRIATIVESELVPSGQRVLDYGCGGKPYRSLLNAKFAEYVGADLPQNGDADLVLGRNGEIPVADGSFDCVLSSQVLEHVEDPLRYLREAHRVLRREGHLIISTHGIWQYHPDPIDYWRWTLDGLEYELRCAGFRPVTVHGVLGMESCALQLWQDATFERLPRWLRPVYTGLIQGLIGLIERRHPDDVSTNASVYVILAQKISVGLSGA
jgi:SAM-dependent methyltransferase